MPLIKTLAITLKSRKWGEADRIVTFYTKEIGKIRGVARGARRQKSRLGAAIEPLTICELNLFEKSGDSLYRVSQVDLVEPFVRFRENLTLMAEVINLTDEIQRIHGRTQDEVLFVTQTGPRYMVGARYKFGR